MKSDEALEQIAYLKELTQKTRIKAVYSYPYFMLWGILSMIGYSSRAYLPLHLYGSMWVILWIIGMPVTIFFIVRQGRKHTYTPLLRRIGLQCLILIAADNLLFALLIYYKVYALLNPFWAFQIGLIYLIISVHTGLTYTFIGFWMIISAVVSFFITGPLSNIWLAVSFGGGMLITGIIFRNKVKKEGTGIEE